MRLFKQIKKISSKPESKFPINFAKVFDTFEIFINYVNTTTDFDSHYVYFYMGDTKTLAGIIAGNEFCGENAIPDLSLHYIGQCARVKNNMLFHDILFFPDQVSDIKKCYAGLNHDMEVKGMYKSDDTGMHTVKGVVLACNNVYLCKK